MAESYFEALTNLLFEESEVSLQRHEEFDELIVVPDGLLWYLPFELLPVATNEDNLGDKTHLCLKDVCQIRYSPTRSLAVGPRHRATALASLQYRRA